MCFRDSLDVDLSRSEYIILQELTDISSAVFLYCRLVDDISIILQCEFPTVRRVLDLMANQYPNMLLNVQVSFGYSRFLDLHIYNIKTSQEDKYYRLCRVLAYKEISSFSYTPCFSNIFDGYKHAVVPISLHRIHTRNTLQQDIDHHLNFLHKILKFRMQDPIQVRRKNKLFFRRKKFGKGKVFELDYSNTASASVKGVG